MSLRSMGRWREDQGSSLIEFSLVALMFIVLLFGIVEMGRMVLVYTSIANAARAGARYAIVHGAHRTGSGVNGPSGPGSATQVQTVVQNFASVGLLDTSKLTITVSYSNGNSVGSTVSVTVTYPYDPLVTYFNSMLSTTMASTSQGVIAF
jgi:Flp pilus assembly protein TadG